MANVNCDGAVRMCRAARVTIHQRQQIVINKAQLKAGKDGRTGRQEQAQARRPDDGGFTFQRTLKLCTAKSYRSASDARANDSRNELLLINETHWRNAYNTNHLL